MKQEQEPQGTRRQLLIAPALPLLQNLEPPQYQWRSDRSSGDPVPFEEGVTVIGDRDAFVLGNTYYVVSNGKIYPMSLERFGEHKWKSKFNEYGRTTYVNPPREKRSLPLGVLSKEEKLGDFFTGMLKNNKFSGGEIPLFFVGFLTDQGELFTEFPLDDSFPNLRGEAGLGSLRWTKDDSYFFTWGSQERFDRSRAKDTARLLSESIQNGFEFSNVVSDQQPLAQQILCGHSLGALIALAIAMKYPERVNCVFLLSGPVRGLDRKRWLTRAVVGPFRRYLRLNYGIEEQVTEPLFDLWEDKDYQKKLNEFIVSFRAMGKTIVEFTSTDDLIVPVESTLLRGTANVLNGRLVSSAWRIRGRKPTNAFDALLYPHWVTLDDPDVREYIKEGFGENRAAA